MRLFFKAGIPFFFGMIILFHLVLAESNAQSVVKNESGIPFIKNISPKEYNANGQNWAAAQDTNGLLYFANSGGALLQYDGVRWNSIPVGNGSIVRDVRIDRSGCIFVGMQNDFGYMLPDADGRYVYRSLLDRVDYRDDKFGDFWKIGVGDKDVYFLERHHLFHFKREELNDSLKTIKPIKARTRFHNLFKARGNRFFVHQVDVGLMETDVDSLHLVNNGDFFKRDLLAGVFPHEDKDWLVVTRNRGLFIYSEDGHIKPVKTGFDALLHSSGLYQAIRLSDGNIAIASKYGGLFILSAKGKLIRQIDESAGLANNTVWSVFEDAQKGLWLSLNKGIAYVDYVSPFTNIDRHNGIKGSIHDIIRHNGQIYVTTNYGLFVSGNVRTSPGRIQFTQVPGINTSGWDMLSAWNSLFIVANSGVFKLMDQKAHLLFKYDPWVFYQSKMDSRRIYVGLASGVASFYIQENGSLKDEGKIPGMDIEARTLAEDDEGNLWAASSYQGVLRAASVSRYFNSGTAPQITHFDKESGLPENTFILISDGIKEILFNTPGGIYRYDKNENRFSLNPDFKELNQKKQGDETYLLAEPDAEGNVWSYINQRIVLNKRSEAGRYHLIDTLFFGLPEQEIQCIYPDGNEYIWFGHRNGIYKYDKRKRFLETSVFKVLIREAVLNNHTVLPDNQSDSYRGKVPEIQYNSVNMLRFKFAAPFYLSPEKTVYQYQLENFDRGWSSWTSETQKDYTNLPHGSYSFMVKAKNVYGRVYASGPYSFIIRPPWYHTFLAYLVFTILFGGLTVILIRKLVTYSNNKALAVHQRREEQRRKTEELIRSQVAADFHDELGTRITRISLFSEILKSDLEQVSETTKVYLEKISKNADRLYDETRDFIWQLDPQKDTLADFIARMKSFGDELFEETDILFDLKWKIPNPDALKLEMDMRRNLIRIFKEAMHNALKYAKCKKVRFEIFRENNRLYFSLSDDGIGFSPEQEGGGTGLKNMKTRAGKINAVCTIDTALNKGTRIELSILL